MRLSFLWLVGVVLLAGCGDKAQNPAAAVKGKAAAPAQAPQAPAPGRLALPEAEKKKPEPRKIIYTGHEELIVEDFDQVRADLEKLIEEYDGYVSSSEMTGQPGEPRTGLWTVRIPVANFKPFLDATGKLGQMRRQKLDSEDVTDQYFDMKASVTNLEVREEALRKLYKEKIGGTKLTDLLEVDRELSKVRGDINQRKGQLQRRDKLVEYATLHLTVRDRKAYVPPDSPDFGTGLGRTFFNSIDSLLWVGKGLVYIAVALAPWLAVLAVLVAAGPSFASSAGRAGRNRQRWRRFPRIDRRRDDRSGLGWVRMEARLPNSCLSQGDRG